MLSKAEASHSHRFTHIHNAICETGTHDTKEVQRIFHHIHKFHKGGARPPKKSPTMQAHDLKTYYYKSLEQGFKEWLQTLGYSWQTNYNKPLYLREFFYALEQQNSNDIKQLPENYIQHYITELKQRRKARNPGALSANSINNHISTLRKFSEYLLKQHEINLPVQVEYEKVKQTDLVFSKEEIKKLYKAASNSPLALRDTAMLAIYYGCGLRRAEGAGLLIEDVQLEREILVVRKGKGYKERIVPIAATLQLNLNNYLVYGRPELLKDKINNTFFLNHKGNSIHPKSLYHRLKLLMKATGIYESKPTAGLHTLRHSIATHFLQSGMKLEDIARFLGHSSLESTKIYTHIVNEYSTH